MSGETRSLDKFAALEARMSSAANGASTAPESVSIGFSASREASNPGLLDAASPRGRGHDSSPTTSTAGGARSSNVVFGHIGDAFAGAGKRKRSPAAIGSVDGLGAHLQTPSPHAMAGKGAAINSGATTHSLSTKASGGAPHSAAVTAAAEAELLMQRQQEQEQQQQQLAALEVELSRAREELAERTKAAASAAAAAASEREAAEGLRTELEQSKVEVEAARAAIEGMRSEIVDIRGEQEQEAQRQAAGREALRAALRERCFKARAETRERLARESIRLGTLELDGKAFGGAGWVQKDGTSLLHLAERERSLEGRRAALEEDRKALRKRRAASTKGGGGGDGHSMSGEGAAEGEAASLELLDREEAVNFRASLLAKERAELAAERKQLEREAQEHFHELRLAHELESLEPGWLRDCPSLPTEGAVYEPAAPSADPAKSAKRFVFLELIATGGFSCVFKAYDLQRQQYAACKIHRMTDGWADARKEAFVRHVEREMEITVGVRHRRVVETFAAFEVSQSTVVSVMTYCNGGSLADLLRKQGALSERDAKSVMLQLLCGLRHLHVRAEPIIHYDLKPANILFHDGELKLSDFGLSKVMAPPPAGASAAAAEPGRAGMELTSYGSGTHGYLPPECYDGDQSRVCPRVDVFSAGVVHFVMLFYPEKPFFKKSTQQQIMQMKSHAIRQEADSLDFPGKLSPEAQAFLRRALAPRREDRPEVVELLADPYMQPAAKAK